MTNLVESMKKISFTQRPNLKWSNESGLSLKTHLDFMRTLKDRNSWDDCTAAWELCLSISGSAQKFIQSLDDTDKNSFDELCKRLKEIYVIEKDDNIRLREFADFTWDGKMSVKELAAILVSKLRKLQTRSASSTGSAVDCVLLRHQFLNAIKFKNVKFANFLDRHAPDNTKDNDMASFNKLIDWAAKIYPTFKATDEEKFEIADEPLFFTNYDKPAGINWRNQQYFGQRKPNNYRQNRPRENQYLFQSPLKPQYMRQNSNMTYNQYNEDNSRYTRYSGGDKPRPKPTWSGRGRFAGKIT